MNIAGTTQFPARMGMRAPSYGYTTNRDIHGGVQPSLTRRGRLVGDVIRGLKPTAKFCCRYAANMRLQPTTNAHVHGFLSHGWRDRPGSAGVPPAWVCVGASDRGLKPIVGLHLMHRCVATDEFSRGFQPTERDTPPTPRRVATDEYHPNDTVATTRQTCGCNPRPTTHGHGFRPTVTGIPKSASLRMGNPHTARLEFRRRVATDEFRSWVHPRWVSTHGSWSPHTPMRAGCPRSQAVRHYATIPGVAMRRGAGWDTLPTALELCVRLGLGEGRSRAESHRCRHGRG